ncbi:MAG: hypothetical protein ABI361_08275 [Nitrososphaera sp.]|jgi:5,10-methylenetetrahydrofolate reductase
MKIIYELNPPKIVKGERFDLDILRQDLQGMIDRAVQVHRLVDGIHLTDSVLGIPRISGLTAAAFVKQEISSSTKLSCSLRCRDRNFAALAQAVSDAILMGIDSILLLLGDEPSHSQGSGCGIAPSTALQMLKKEGFDSQIRLELSFPARITDRDSNAIMKKLATRPHSLVTQSIATLEDLGEIVDLAKARSTKVTACIMVPSEKNRQSASLIGLDWSAYEKNPADFVRAAAEMADCILLTSPNSFSSGLDLLRQLQKAG